MDIPHIRKYGQRKLQGIIIQYIISDDTNVLDGTHENYYVSSIAYALAYLMLTLTISYVLLLTLFCNSGKSGFILRTREKKQYNIVKTNLVLKFSVSFFISLVYTFSSYIQLEVYF